MDIKKVENKINQCKNYLKRLGKVTCKTRKSAIDLIFKIFKLEIILEILKKKEEFKHDTYINFGMYKGMYLKDLEDWDYLKWGAYNLSDLKLRKEFKDQLDKLILKETEEEMRMRLYYENLELESCLPPKEFENFIENLIIKNFEKRKQVPILKQKIKDLLKRVSKASKLTIKELKSDYESLWQYKIIQSESFFSSEEEFNIFNDGLTEYKYLYDQLLLNEY